MYLSTGIFQDIAEENFQKMMTCFHSRQKHYPANEIITTYGSQGSRIGIILEGEIMVIRTHYDGRQTILEHLEPGDIFGETLSVIPNSISLIQVISVRPCLVQYIDYQCLIRRCSKACPWHSALVNNALRLISQKAVHLGERLEVLSQRTTREKLICYFSLASFHSHSDTFLLPFSLSTLADYLCVDRSAMMREIRKLKDDHLISIVRRQVTVFFDRSTPSDVRETHC